MKMWLCHLMRGPNYFTDMSVGTLEIRLGGQHSVAIDDA